jgi:DNA-binding NtrC family response regulator
LWDEDIERLRSILEVLRNHHQEVLELWYQLYTIHFGEARTLSEREFGDLYGHDLHRLVTNLLKKNMENFIADLQGSGERLVARGVPFREMVASLHLFEESCSQVFDTHRGSSSSQYDSQPSKAELFFTFDKLSHCRLMILGEAYFEATRARSATRVRALEREVTRLSPDVRQRRHFHGIVGQSAAMQDIFQRIQAAASSRSTVFIIGESGTGKELVAQAIHELGSEKGVPFVPVNCASLPRELIESELFGYKRGAFSGAVSEYMGLFRAAEGGTLFLDEVTEMAPETQAKLLRALQERTIRPVGSLREIPVNTRIIASTNTDPQEAMNKGLLRRDLYYRLNVNTLRLPPLRERSEDLPLLVDYFLEFFSERFGVPQRRPTAEALQALQRYSWPGNVRELMNVIESAYTFGRGETIGLADLPPTITSGPTCSANPSALLSPLVPFAEVERDLIARALKATAGNKLRAAKLLGISRKKLYARIGKYDLESATARGK